MSDSQASFVAGLEFVLLEEAAAAAASSKAATAPNKAGGGALAAILLSAAALEAHIGIWTRLFKDHYSISDSTVRTWRNRSLPDVMKDILAQLHPPVAAADIKWFNGVCAVFKLRNQVAHYFPDYRAPGEWPPEIAGLITGHVILPAGDDTMDWTSRILVGSVAEQVLDCATDGINKFDLLAWKKPAA